MSYVGILIGLVVDLALPAAVAVLLAAHNFRYRATNRGERLFWIWMGIYSAWLVVLIVPALITALELDGARTFAATVAALPMSGVPATVNSTLMHLFFTPSQWAAYGYYVVIAGYLIGLLPWALLLPLGVRRIVQWNSRREPYVQPPVPLMLAGTAAEFLRPRD